MDTDRLNLVFNIITVLLGGGALGIILKYRLGTRKQIGRASCRERV